MGDYNLSLEIKTVGAKEALDSLNLLDKKGREIVDDVAGATGRAMGDVASTYERGGAKVRYQLEQIAIGHRETIVEIEKQEKAAARMYGSGAAGLGRVRQGLVSLAASATDTAPTLDRLGASLLSMTAGAGLTLGVTAGIAAIALAYRFLTKDASDAAEAQEKALDALRKWVRERDAGIGGGFAVNVNEARTNRDAALAALTLQQQRVVGFGGPTTEGGAIAAKLLPGLKAAYDAAAALVTAGEAHLTEIRQQAAASTAAADIHNLATLITAHNAKAGEVRNAIGLLTGLRQSLNALAGDGSQNAARAVLIDQIKELSDALFPADKLGAQQLAQRIAQGLEAYTHGIHEQAAEYKRVSEETVREFERAQDEETAIGLAQASERAKNEQRVYKEEADKAVALLAGSASRAHGMDLGGLRDAIRKSLEEGGVLMEDAVQALSARMNHALSTILGEGIAAGFEKAFSGRSGDAFKSLTASVLAGLGGFMQALGAQMIVVGIGLEAFATALLSLNGPAAILAGVALVAAGAGLKAIASNISGSMTAGGTAGTGVGAPPSFLSFGVQAASPPTTAQAPPAARSVNNWTIIGPADPQAQRAIGDIVGRADRRGLITWAP